MSVAIVGDEVRYSYVFALAGRTGYGKTAYAAAGVLLSLFRAYLPPSWRPLRVELDTDRPSQAGLFEDVFQCPVLFNAPAVTVVTERHHLSASPRRAASPIVTIEDVARDRRGGAPRELLDIVVEQIRAQVLTGSVSIDSAARSIDTSVRTLQRELNRAGTDFRSLAGAARAQRAIELLRATSGSVTRVSAELGYSSPANFARAFRQRDRQRAAQFPLEHVTLTARLSAALTSPLPGEPRSTRLAIRVRVSAVREAIVPVARRRHFLVAIRTAAFAPTLTFPIRGRRSGAPGKADLPSRQRNEIPVRVHCTGPSTAPSRVRRQPQTLETTAGGTWCFPYRVRPLCRHQRVGT